VIATPDRNPKIGTMLCTWILDQEIAPEIAAFNGIDESICGGCKFRAQPKLDAHPLRPASTRMCYVRLSSESDAFGTPKADEVMGPAEVWQAWKNGEFGRWQSFGPVPAWQSDERRMSWYQYHGHLTVRIGSYGDPGAAPTDMWKDLIKHAKNWTGYTHLWRPKNCNSCGSRWKDEYSDFEGKRDYMCLQCGGLHKAQCDPELKTICMASVDTPEELGEAIQLGWRAFIVVPEESLRLFEADQRIIGRDHISSSVLCPMTAGKNVTCDKCHMCQGTSSKVKQHIHEKVHGVNLKDHVW